MNIGSELWDKREAIFMVLSLELRKTSGVRIVRKFSLGQMANTAIKEQSWVWYFIFLYRIQKEIWARFGQVRKCGIIPMISSICSINQNLKTLLFFLVLSRMNKKISRVDHLSYPKPVFFGFALCQKFTFLCLVSESRRVIKKPSYVLPLKGTEY